MEIDTGAAVSVRLGSELTLEQPTLCLCTYTVERMTVLGEASVVVRYGKYKGYTICTL